MNYLLFALPGNEKLTASLASLLPAEQGEVTLRQFPDGETYVQLNTDVQGRHLLLICTLYQPDAKLLPLYFLARTAKELGAASITLVAPYLAYMRQDKRFRAGEGITNRYFASLLSSFADNMLTMDPHLHRVHNMNDLFTIPVTVLHAAPTIANYIKQTIVKPLLIGPDEESRQWVSEVATMANAPFIVLKKTRTGDRQVQIEVPDIAAYQDCTPVLVDDIISTARTMIETIGHLKGKMPQQSVCIGVHGIFAGDAYEALLQAGAGAIVTCNTIPHPTNQISLDKLLADAIVNLEL
ncbi:ribose-phosphate pyrophosphokinase [Pontibacter fetidus]|uniref:ribose-phosphate diphosphokinase n=1 Tax=Pontibacter fetidus TaxID=2700082 RepID=A0A6B2GZY6_9BACT|nr:ribose-phosphate pyrophosphokinase [Pontibacter fetidus]NDK55621.1 ribose-phosphate pyrophosphokinase [Pontibacter fetidus]